MAMVKVRLWENTVRALEEEVQKQVVLLMVLPDLVLARPKDKVGGKEKMAKVVAQAAEEVEAVEMTKKEQVREAEVDKGLVWEKMVRAVEREKDEAAAEVITMVQWVMVRDWEKVLVQRPALTMVLPIVVAKHKEEVKVFSVNMEDSVVATVKAWVWAQMVMVNSAVVVAKRGARDMVMTMKDMEAALVQEWVMVQHMMAI